ncbi:MAG: acyl transferase [Owenweeksia sp.]
MLSCQYFKNRIFELHDARSFEGLALELFRYQAQENRVYAEYIGYLGLTVSDVQTLDEIPFLPIDFFKQFAIQTGDFEPEVVFTSSGTTGQKPSRHLVKEKDWYHRVFREAFRRQYGGPQEYCILALLPSYLERKGSSLIEMTEALIELSGDMDSGFYLNDFERLIKKIAEKQQTNRQVLLLGVTFALLDLTEKYGSHNWSNIKIMETGGMKGRRREMIRSEVHQVLQNAFGVTEIHSEYGMTELMSQAYAKREGLFECPPWMKVRIREVADPFSKAPLGKTGGINIIDLANVDSCAFIETQDLGRLYSDGRFEVMGRFDHSDVRGCNLMVV